MKGRYVATREEWQELRERKLIGKTCRVCGKPPTGLHHLVGRDLGGDDVAENVIPLSGTGTSGCHGLAEQGNRAVRALIRATMTRAEEGYVRLKMGAYWLEHHYPKVSEEELAALRWTNS